MRFETKGFDKIIKDLNDMQSTAKELEKGVEVPFSVLFNQSFMSNYTQFNSFDDLLKAGNFVTEKPEDFDAIPDDELDKHIKETTRFSNWQEMLDTAGTEHITKKLGF